MKQLFAASALVLLIFTLAACGGVGSTAPSKSISVQITETDFHIASSVTSFVPGKIYHFVVTNQGQTMHELMIMPKAEGNMNGVMGSMDKTALASIDMIDPGGTRTLDYTFPFSAMGSHPQMACYLPGHYEAGMKLDLAVNGAEVESKKRGSWLFVKNRFRAFSNH